MPKGSRGSQCSGRESGEPWEAGDSPPHCSGQAWPGVLLLLIESTFWCANSGAVVGSGDLFLFLWGGWKELLVILFPTDNLLMVNLSLESLLNLTVS